MPRPVARLLPPTHLPAALRQLAAVAAVGAIGSTVLAVSPALPQGLREVASARAAAPSAALAPLNALPAPVRAAERLSASAGTVSVPAAAAPARAAAHPAAAPAHPAAAPRVARPAATPQRWLPAGTGMWIYEWRRTDRGNAGSVVAHARRAQLTHLFVRTGSTHDGFAGGPVLRSLLPATRGSGVRVVAWDFPELKHPSRDAQRLARAAWFGRQQPSSPHVAAVAPDIETAAEGTRMTGARVRAYLLELRRLLPTDVAILATVPWPSRARRGHYPYGTVASASDALLPMAYWYNNPPRLVTSRSIAFLRRFHKPIQPVGQGYDGHKEWHWLPHNNLSRQVPAFLETAHQMGASAVSLWSWQAAPASAWAALTRYHSWFGPAGRR